MRFASALLLAIASGTACADSICYDISNYPFAWYPEKTDAGITFLTQAAHSDGLRGHETELIRMTGGANGFMADGTEACNSWQCSAMTRTDACPKDMPAIHVSRDQLPEDLRQHYTSADLDQAPNACVTVGDEIYFGLAFYGGEGALGVGGVGRWNRTTGELVVRHAERLKSVSINHIAFDGKRLWIGTYDDAECSGEIPASRVLVYDWEQDRFEGQYQRGVPNLLTCGFVVQGFALESPQHMWVASDLGITRVKIVEESMPGGVGFGSEHWWAERGADGVVMKRGECEEQYDHLLQTLSLKDISTYVSPLDQLVGTLMRFNGYYVRRQLLEKVHADRGIVRMAIAYRETSDGRYLQDCESGALYLPKGDAWDEFVRVNTPAVSRTNTPVRYALAVIGRILPKEVGGSHAAMEVLKFRGSASPSGYCGS